MRKSGILMPIASLPSEYGIGCFSKSAYDFADWLKSAGQSYWQILPLCPTGFGDSPYQSFSTFAGNPYFISLKELINQGLLTRKECDEIDFGAQDNKIDYEKQYKNRFSLLRRAYMRSDIENNRDFTVFCHQNNYWLEDYSLFMALKDKFNNVSRTDFDTEYRLKDTDITNKIKDEPGDEIMFWKFVQFEFYRQWENLKTYAHKNNISIIGDMPIYVSSDSSDVWANPSLFELDRTGTPLSVAGCPPDGFSQNGQLWGNPLYNWEYHKKTKFEWWIKRIKHSFNLYDVVRIDHFRGFDEYYSIKFGSENAKNGVWRKAPGNELFKTVESALGKKDIIAEDLGFITDSVKKLLKDCQFPGMKILQFAFDSRDSSNANEYIPHNYPFNSVAYTGTHDNFTLVGWYKSISQAERKTVRDYLCDSYTPDSHIHKPLISLILRSNSKLCIIPIQDWLGLDDNARINVPSTTGNNWCWRIKKEQLDSRTAKEIYKMTKLYSRL